MKLNHQVDHRITILRMEGELTLDELEPLRKLVVDQLGANCYDFVVDLSAVDFVDSKGLETLLWVREQSADRLGQVRLVSPSATVRQILRMTRLDRDFETHQTIDEAVSSLR
jgi:anti-sigma B factor antagonist